VSLDDEQVLVSTEAVSEQGGGSDREDLSDSSGGSKNTSDSGSDMKIGVEATLVDVSYSFGQSIMMRACVTALESFARYFLKGFAQPPGTESVPDPR
jgi:hypothetical protein